jgi:hypothetical protein
MEKKQTAVEWLASYIKAITDLNCDEIIEQAKQMEMEEIKQSYREGRSDQQSARQERFYHRNAELFYNETYGKTIRNDVNTTT